MSTPLINNFSQQNPQKQIMNQQAKQSLSLKPNSKTERISLLLNSNIQRIYKQTQQMKLIKKNLAHQIDKIKKINKPLSKQKQMKSKQKSGEKLKEKINKQENQKPKYKQRQNKQTQSKDKFQDNHNTQKINEVKDKNEAKLIKSNPQTEQDQINNSFDSIQLQTNKKQQKQEINKINQNKLQQQQSQIKFDKTFTKTHSSARFLSLFKLQTADKSKKQRSNRPTTQNNEIKRKLSHKQFNNMNKSQKQSIVSIPANMNLKNISQNQNESNLVLINSNNPQKTLDIRFKQKLLQSKSLINTNKSRLLSSQTQFKLLKQLKKNKQLQQKQQQLNELFLHKLQHQTQNQQKLKNKRKQQRFLHQNKLISINIIRNSKTKMKKIQENIIKLKAQQSKQDMVYRLYLKEKQQIQKRQRLMYKLQFLKGMSKNKQL